MGITKFRHELSSFDVPHGDETSIVSRDDGLKFGIIESELNRILVTCLDFLLGFEL